MRLVIPEILSLLSNAHPALKPTPEMARVWEALLGEHSDDGIRRAATAVSRQAHYGAPTVGDLVEHLEGRVVSVRVPVTDVWNRTILRSDGSPTYTIEQRRVWPDGRSEPAALPAHEEGITMNEDEGPVEIAGLLE